MTSPMPGDIFQTGQVLNNTYEILGVLGRGGTGEVYLARNQVVDRKVAIKALNMQFSGNADYIELMKREEEMRDIIHDAVVRYSECSRSDQGHVFLVMDFVDGISLNDAMQDRRLQEKELLIIGHRVLEGLVAVHNHGIVHRDLSPDNIILRDGQAERATIIDFGIAKDTAADARTIVGNDFAGKYEYAAPEQLEGKAEYRTDLYSLGASLLAAHRREVPFLGATPGEIIRRKQEPLDTSGVSEPLKELIDWLTQPNPADRPADAAAALERADDLLRPQARRPAPEKNQKRGKRRKARALLLGLPLLAGAVAAGLWGAGFFQPSLPVASPYKLTASINDAGQGAFMTNAPDAETGQFLVNSFEATLAITVTDPAIDLALGAPSDTWPKQVASLFGLVNELESWSLDVSNQTVKINGLAINIAGRTKAEAAINEWSAQSGFRIQVQLAAGPRVLPASKVVDFLQPYQNCGQLEVTGNTDSADFALNDTITIRGDLVSDQSKNTIEEILKAQIGDRKLKLETRTLNPDLCAVRAVLPTVDSSDLSIWLADGETGDLSLTGVFTTGQYVVVEVHLPATISQGSLSVMVVDNTEKVYHLLPNSVRTQQQISQIGEVQGGIRRVRIMYPKSEINAQLGNQGMKVDPDSYGKSEVIAILSKDDLFTPRRPGAESVQSAALAIEEVVNSNQVEIIAIASRIIDARP